MFDRSIDHRLNMSRPFSARNVIKDLKQQARRVGRGGRPSSSRAVVMDHSRAQGSVWVPPMTQKELSEQAQYWNKFKVAKNDPLFKEVVERFDKKAFKTNLIEKPVPSFARSKSCDALNRNKLYKSGPYPSGSCKTVQHGKFSNFCVVPRQPLYSTDST